MAPRKPGAAELRLLQEIDDLRETVVTLTARADDAERRAALAEAGDSSGLAELLPEGEAVLVGLVEGALLRALTAREAYFLGQMVQGWGPARCEAALKRKVSSREPIRAAYALLKNGAHGQPAAQKEGKPLSVVTYQSLDDLSY